MSMKIMTILSLGIATNLDNVCIGIAYGLAGKQIKAWHNLLVSFISGAFACAACVAAQLITQAYAAYALTVGALLLIGLGAYTFAGVFRTQRKCDESAVRPVGLREMMLLGVTLALNCLAASFGVGLSGVSAISVGASVMGFSYIAIVAGNLLGIRTRKSASSRWLNMASGAILLVMGVCALIM